MKETLCSLIVYFTMSFAFAGEANIYAQRVVNLMDARWQTPQRAVWEIEYKPISGALDSCAWHIKDTGWRVRLYPELYDLEELDKSIDYEIDAVALDQNYGVIAFYTYELKAIKEPE